MDKTFHRIFWEDSVSVFFVKLHFTMIPNCTHYFSVLNLASSAAIS